MRWVACGRGGHEFNTGFVDKGFRQCMTAGVSLKLVGLGGHTMSGLVPFLYAVDCSVKQMESLFWFWMSLNLS